MKKLPALSLLVAAVCGLTLGACDSRDQLDRDLPGEISEEGERKATRR